MEVLCRALCSHHACELVHHRPETADWVEAVKKDFRSREMPSTLYRWTHGMSSTLLFSCTIAILLAYDRTQQHSLGAISIFFGGIAAVLTPRLLQLSYTLKSTVSESIRTTKYPPRPAYTGKQIEDSHLRLVLAMLHLRTVTEYVPLELMTERPGPMLQNSAPNPTNEETETEDDYTDCCVATDPMTLKNVCAADSADGQPA